MTVLELWIQTSRTFIPEIILKGHAQQQASGAVIDQSPLAGSRLLAASTIDLTVAVRS